MSANVFKIVSCILCATIIILFTFFSLGMYKAETTTVKTVYYVLDCTESVEAGSCQISLRGGAGYVMPDGVAFGVYFSEGEAERTCRRLEGEYNQVAVHPVVISFLSSEDVFAYNVLQIVEEWTKILQNGGSQAIVRDGLRSASELLSWRGERDCSSFLLNLSAELKSCLSEKVLYVDALRNFTCFGCEQLSLKNKMIRI